MKTNSSNSDQHNFKLENSQLKKENTHLKQEVQILQSQNDLLKNQLRKIGQKSNNIHGFCIVKQGDYFAAAKRMDGKLHRVYIGKTTDDAKKKIHAYLEKIGYFKKLSKATKSSEPSVKPAQRTDAKPISAKQASTQSNKPNKLAAKKEKPKLSQVRKSQSKTTKKTSVDTRLSKAK